MELFDKCCQVECEYLTAHGGRLYPGILEVLETLSGHDIVVEYLYSFVRNAGDHALIIFRVDKLDEAEKVLTEAGVRLLSQDEVRGL